MAGWLLGCSLGVAASPAPLNVVTTIGMLGDVTENIGGRCVDVVSLMGPGIDPHTYQARASDVPTLNNADLILYSGYSLEGKLASVLERFKQRRPTLAVSERAIAPDRLIRVNDAYGTDPHLWMDVELWGALVPTIAEAIKAQRPECADTIAANAETYRMRLSALDDWITRSIKTIPEQQRILVTAHDAFNYYGRAYGIDVEGIQGISTETETGIADIRAMANVVAERQVPAMFVESTISPRTIRSVIEAARQKGQTIEVGGELYSDAMGETGRFEGTYIGMLYANTQRIVTALGGRPAPLPNELADLMPQDTAMGAHDVN
ncbi:metal ABC transporter solute-binding protein, Zn/Mn family [Larsenimonas suaedae]|uniref:Zinc ABC transporter substrate-binding protein n=1 Tax=Larsenimonas suaedae TaxID=1851019 RepID=A0ABU1GWE5_9GAMM|nr:zinc ABC transporter substrate-binding protein [Larsenimonas suaedae]MCM2972917.1 zinc ABC transporter substrate-binding protein [Larsenimonas suaedae]MDR5896354.1 zinc ABC transporter substrate-binding protein [Larsenimonas suaedae]